MECSSVWARGTTGDIPRDFGTAAITADPVGDMATMAERGLKATRMVAATLVGTGAARCEAETPSMEAEASMAMAGTGAVDSMVDAAKNA